MATITKSTLTKTAVNEILFGEPANPTVANRPHQNLETNIDDILSYLKNDGAGSGMNSDLLDGQQGSYYQNASNLNAGTLPAARFTDISHGNRSGGSLHSAVTTTANGFMSSADKTKLNGIETGATADQTASEILASLLTVDGSGSGLDADFFDGQDSGYYTNIPARLGYTPVNKAGDTMGNPLAGPNAVSAGQYIPLGQADARYGRMTSGTRMLFAQAAAPTGWTQDTSINDRVIRIVSGSGGGTGGSWTISGLYVGGHALTVAETPEHFHYIANTDTGSVGGLSASNTLQKFTNSGTAHEYDLSGDGTPADVGKSGNATNPYNAAQQAANQAHSHPISQNGSWRPAYSDVIIAYKN